MAITNTTQAREFNGRMHYGLGNIVKSVTKGIKGAVKGAAKGVSNVLKSDAGKLGLAALAAYYGTGGFQGMPAFLRSPVEAFQGLGPKGKFFTVAGLGALGTAAMSALDASDLDQSDPNAEIDLDSLRGYLSRGYKNLNPNATEEEVFQFVQENTAEYRSDGGRIGRAMGSDEKVEMAAGIEGLPVNVNSKGIKELDLRETGGFIPPVGVKEKADDIPAMLSNNEFVFTADAVRAAGGGSVDKGAQILYDTMKRLESKIA
tara:strand:- start:845 stop:1624 length:780 start_codon:yes stop_codon:yes gene_type:complete